MTAASAAAARWSEATPIARTAILAGLMGGFADVEHRKDEPKSEHREQQPR